METGVGRNMTKREGGQVKKWCRLRNDLLFQLLFIFFFFLIIMGSHYILTVAVIIAVAFHFLMTEIVGGGELDIKNCTTVLGLRQMWPNSLYYRIMSIFDLRYGE